MQQSSYKKKFIAMNTYIKKKRSQIKNLTLKKKILRGGVKMAEQEDAEFVTPNKYIKNTSTGLPWWCSG